MSLKTDKIFIAALRADATIMRLTGGRVYDTAIPLPDAEADNVPCPYLIVMFDSLTNTGWTKDDGYEGDVDNVSISVQAVAVTRDALATLTERVRKVIQAYFIANQGDELTPINYTFSASDVSYDQYKPCFAQTLGYQCETNI